MKWILFGKVGTFKGRLATALGEWCKSNGDPMAPEAFIRKDGTIHTDRVEYEREMRKQGLESKPANFAVTGKPRSIPWHIRRKELEAAARTKRKRLESFQE